MAKKTKKSQDSARLLVSVDSCFLVALSNGDDKWHAAAERWAKFLAENNGVIFVSAIALSEFAVNGDISELLMTGLFTPILFDTTDARITGECFSKWKKTAGKFANDATAAKNDIKIVANSIKVKATHVLTTDGDIPNICKKLHLQLKVIDFRSEPCDSLTSKDGQTSFKNFP